MGMSCAEHEPPCPVEECSPYLLSMHPALRSHHGNLLLDATAPLLYSHVSTPSVRAGRKSVHRCLALLTSKILTPNNILTPSNIIIKNLLPADDDAGRSTHSNSNRSIQVWSGQFMTDYCLILKQHKQLEKLQVSKLV